MSGRFVGVNNGTKTPKTNWQPEVESGSWGSPYLGLTEATIVAFAGPLDQVIDGMGGQQAFAVTQRMPTKLGPVQSLIFGNQPTNWRISGARSFRHLGANQFRINNTSGKGSILSHQFRLGYNFSPYRPHAEAESAGHPQMRKRVCSFPNEGGSRADHRTWRRRTGRPPHDPVWPICTHSRATQAPANDIACARYYGASDWAGKHHWNHCDRLCGPASKPLRR